MRSIKNWGKVVEGVLIRGWIGCSQAYTGVGMLTSELAQVGGNMRVVRYLTVIFPKVFTQFKNYTNPLLISRFSLLSTPPIISETN